MLRARAKLRAQIEAMEVSEGEGEEANSELGELQRNIDEFVEYLSEQGGPKLRFSAGERESIQTMIEHLDSPDYFDQEE